MTIAVDSTSAPRGLAVRAPNFPELEELAKSGPALERVSSAAVTGLVLRGVRVLSPDIPHSAVQLLAILTEHIYQADRWRTGKLRVTASNARLAHMLGMSERAIRRLLALLEEEHWIIRRYNNANRRGDIAGIDLKPLAARLGELQQVEMAINEAALERRAFARTEREEREVSAGDGRTETSTQEDRDVHLKPYNLNPGIDLVQGSAKEPEVQPSPGPFSLLTIEEDHELIGLMAEASPTLQRQLAPDDLAAILEGDLSPRVVLAVSRAVTWLLRGHVRLRPDLWSQACSQHGWAALAAVLVAVDREGVRNPAAYLATMLRSSCLRKTVQHNLRSLASRGAAHA